MISSSSQVLYVWLLIITWVALAATIFLSSISAAGPDTLNIGLFRMTLSSSGSSRIPLDISPAPWTFSIWFFIWGYQVIWMIYATTNLFRGGIDGTRLYAIAPFLSWPIFATFFLNLVSVTAWLFLWDRDYIIPSLVALVFSVITNICCAYISVFGIYKYYPLLCAQGFRIENRLVLGLVTNGIGMYTSWLVVATHLNLGRVLLERAGLMLGISGSITFSLLTFLLALWFVLDLGVLEKYTRFLYTPYIVFSVALSGISVQNFDAESPTQIYIVMLLITSLAMLALKILLAIRNQNKDPAFPLCKEKMETETMIAYT